VRLYDTARRDVHELEVRGRVTMYTCGITPYDSAHLGHAAVYFTYDLVQRRLRDAGHQTRCVRNVTDVDDDILRKARELGIDYLQLANSEVERFSRDMADLGLLPVFSEPRATGAIPDILGFIGMALESGHAYRSGGAVYFDVSSFPAFGSLSGLSPEEMLVLAAERGGNPDDPLKRHPLDFVLWQPSLPDEPAWESLWGPGRPGWHVECSTLALRELGETIDLHGGGNDLVFPHHECERAQSESVTGTRFVRHWVHVGMVGLKGVKMSKSLGNLVFVRELLDAYGTAAVRIALASQHYRSAWDYDDSLMDEASARFDRWRSSSGRAGGGEVLLDRVRARLDDDLDAPGALAEIDDAADSAGDLRPALALLGIHDGPVPAP
jgi:L-cysteine:1D-myo-inositol 2-amino-2-deoxy-alpha-D-glucopyranoside ligase